MANEKTEKPMIIYDMVSLPDLDPADFITIRDLFRAFQKEKLVLWDSSKGGNEPQVIPPGDYKIKDVNNEEDK